MQRIVVFCLGFLGLLALPNYLSGQQGGPPASDVVVVNEPLQVTGTVEVTNEPVEVTGSVEVTNEPLSVEVSNLPQPATPPRFQLVGFTNTASPGDINGPFGVVLLCQAEVHPESRMCTQVEVSLTTSVPMPLPSDPSFRAWVWPNDAASPPFNFSESCTSWTTSHPSALGTAVNGEGAPVRHTSLRLCGESLPIACCALVP